MAGRLDCISIDLRMGPSEGGGGGGSRLRGGEFAFLDIEGVLSCLEGSEGLSSGVSLPEFGTGRLGSLTDSVHVDTVLICGAPLSLLFAYFSLSVQFGSELADDGSTGDSVMSCLLPCLDLDAEK